MIRKKTYLYKKLTVLAVRLNSYTIFEHKLSISLLI